MKYVVAFLGMLLIASSVPQLAAKTSYKPGQVWAMSQGITVTVLAVENVHRVGKVVHVRIDKIPWQRCGNVRLTRAIDHLAVTEKVMRKSDLALVTDSVDLPQSSIDAYREGETKKKHEIVKIPLQKALGRDDLTPPMICNFTPSQT